MSDNQELGDTTTAHTLSFDPGDEDAVVHYGTAEEQGATPNASTAAVGALQADLDIHGICTVTCTNSEDTLALEDSQQAEAASSVSEEHESITVITEDGQHILSYIPKDGRSGIQTVEGLTAQDESPHTESASQEMPASQDSGVWSVESMDSIDQYNVANQPVPTSAAAIPGGSEADQFVLSFNPGATAAGADVTDLQSLLSSGVARLTNARGEPVQIITLSSGQDLSGQTGGKVLQLIGNPTGTAGGATLLLQQSQTQQERTVDPNDKGEAAATEVTEVSDLPGKLTLSLPESLSSILMPPPLRPSNVLLAGSPSWTGRLSDCEKIGDAYRGWVETEIELDLLLTLHKQYTHSFWGTRQSPSPAKQSTRLMWKSQYVPFDGIPFVNSGSRAIVMECQFGPRRKGTHVKKVTEPVNKDKFKQTCPARIYIKKVRKFLEYQVDLNSDKKSLKLSMDKAFQLLKERGFSNFGHERYYVQLPTEEAHEFHSVVDQMEVPLSPRIEAPQRLDCRVAQKIREFVAAGEARLYAVRKSLRHYVEKELFSNQEDVPEKHNLSFYPTVNDLQNHIHQAIKDIEGGVLPITAQTVNVEVVANGDGSQLDTADLKSTLWQTGLSANSPHAETVTVTLTQNPGEDGQHIISRVETHLSDGSTQISTTLTPETARLLAKLHPNMFPASGLLQVTLPYLQEGDTPQPVTIVTNSTNAAAGLESESMQEDLVGHTPPDLESTVPIYGVMEQVEGATGLEEPMEVSMVADNDVIKVELDRVEVGHSSDQDADVINQVVAAADETAVLMGETS